MRLLTALRYACLVEAVSTLILFGVAMPLKHYAGMPVAVKIAGSAHGGLFMLVMGLLVAACSAGVLRPKLALLVAIGAVVPGVAFFVDHKLKAAQQAGE
jgi:integral membrane protein